jgi:maltose alpha-D-glucosyltransferase/alpha-amylase
MRPLPQRPPALNKDTQAGLWYKDAIIYELHVRSFLDSDGSGTGDFAGLTQKLDYIQELGVTALWLLPFCPSPWRDDGYDVSDYAGIHPAYGCLDDFRAFLEECRRRSLRVITELVLNHTSDTHPWFERARRSPAGSAERDFYVWSDTPERYSAARIIFSDFESSNWTWDPVAQAYYWHRFYSHQPDLNFDNPDVRQAVFDAVDFWFGLGVDGLRLDAVPYLFEREGTNCENLPETHAFLRDLRRHVDSRFPGRMLLAEANQWPEDAAAYFREGDECHMAFHFPLMPRLFMATRMEDSFPIINIIEQTPAIPDSCQWATFLRNHDELTLEMVCEEERDYMYRMYANDPEMRINIGIRRRLAPLLENDRRRIELMNALLLSLPGTPVIYYGDEIGMGDNLALGDRNGVRTPMQWTAGRNAGFSDADPEKLYLPVITGCEYDHAFVNVEAQQHKEHSLLWWMRRAIASRRESAALTRGSIHFLYPANRHVLAFVRQTESEDVLVVVNLSRSAQSVRLDLSTYAGRTPVELFGHVEFPAVGRSEYTLSLGPYGYYWLALSPAARDSRAPATSPVTVAAKSAADVLDWEYRAILARILLPFLKSASRIEPRTVTHAEVVDIARFGDGSAAVFIQVFFGGGDPELQLIPLSVLQPNAAAALDETDAVPLGRLQTSEGLTLSMISGSRNGALSGSLMELIAKEERLETRCGILSGCRVGPFTRGVLNENLCLVPQSQAEEQRNVSVRLGDIYVLKLLRRLEPGPSPDIDVVRFLFERAGFTHVAPAAGYLEYAGSEQEPAVAGVLHGYVDNRHDLWQYTLDQLRLFLERAAAAGSAPVSTVRLHPMDSEPDEVRAATDLVQTYVGDARLLGQRVAEMHLALSVDLEDPAFAPEPFTTFYMRGRYHSFAGMVRSVMDTLDKRAAELPREARADAGTALGLTADICQLLNDSPAPEASGLRIRVHGDLHLGQVLHTGADFVFIDFEGDVTLPLRERVLKRSPLVDLAGILFSLRYAAASVVANRRGGFFHWYSRSADLEAWVRFWLTTVSGACLQSYRGTLAGSPLIPAADDDFRRLLDLHLLAKAVYQVGYELLNRPQWTPVALRALLEVVSLVRDMRR